MRTTTRLAAGTLALTLPLVAVVGCGVEKKRTIKQELSSALSNLENAKAVSVTLSLDDSKGAVAALAKRSDGAPPPAAVDELLGSSITYTFGSGSDKKLKDLQTGQSVTDLKGALKDINLGFVIRDAKATIGEIRLVSGTLYARVDVDEIVRVAKEAGADDVESSIDDFIGSAPATAKPALEDAKADKWLKLPLDEYLDKLKDLAKDFPTPAPSSNKADPTKIGKDLFAAAKPFIKVTDANDSSSNRVLDVNIQAKSAAKAILTTLKGEKDLPFGKFLDDVSASDIDDNLSDGTAHGTITLKSGHLSQITVDIDSIRKLDPKAKAEDAVAGSSAVIDINDAASPVSAPTTDVSSVDVKKLITDLFSDFAQGFGESLTGSGEVTG